MATNATQTIYVKAEDKPVREGALNYIQFNANDRMKRALGVLGICWALAAVTLFIPIAHFVLVPGFLIAGPIMAFMRYKVERAAESVTVKCPACDADVTIKLDANDQTPMYRYCPQCRKSLQLADK